MKLIVFGPTGRSGLAVLDRASRDPDFEVTAYLRKPQKVPEEVRKCVKIIIGDVRNIDQVADALAGQDAVISCLGTGFNLGETTVISEGIKNILDGMKKHGIKQITAVGVSFLMPHEFEPFPLKKVGADHKRAYEIMKQYRDINWICMAPPEIVNLPYTGTCQATINKLITHVVTTQDLADWMLQCSKDPEMVKEYSHQLVGISSSLGAFTWLTQTTPGVMMLIAAAILIGGGYLAYLKFA